MKIFADGADLDGLLRLAADPRIKGFTTNPTLMRKAGVADYGICKVRARALITDRPISFEVFSDDVDEMRAQALEIASWGSNVYVKIPVTNTRGESTAALVRELSHEGVQLNVTALMTLAQVETMTEALAGWRSQQHLGVRRAASPTRGSIRSRSWSSRSRSCARRRPPS